MVTPDEVIEALAHEMPPDMRLAGRLPGEYYRQFHRTEMIWTHMLELGMITQPVYESIMGSRLSFKFNLPAMAAPDYIKAVGEAKNPTPLLALISQAVGAKKLGEKTVAIRREEVPGMDPRSIQEILEEPLVRQELSFEAGLEIAGILASKQVASGLLDDEEARDLMQAARHFQRLMGRLLQPPSTAQSKAITVAGTATRPSRSARAATA